VWVVLGERTKHFNVAIRDQIEPILRNHGLNPEFFFIGEPSQFAALLTRLDQALPAGPRVLIVRNPGLPPEFRARARRILKRVLRAGIRIVPLDTPLLDVEAYIGIENGLAAVALVDAELDREPFTYALVVQGRVPSSFTVHERNAGFHRGLDRRGALYQPGGGFRLRDAIYSTSDRDNNDTADRAALLRTIRERIELVADRVVLFVVNARIAHGVYHTLRSDLPVGFPPRWRIAVIDEVDGVLSTLPRTEYRLPIPSMASTTAAIALGHADQGLVRVRLPGTIVRYPEDLADDD
jgi:hypothetical protein